MSAEYHHTDSGTSYTVNSDGTVTRRDHRGSSQRPSSGGGDNSGWWVFFFIIIIIIAIVAGVNIYNENSYLNVSRTNVSMDASGGTTSINVNSNRDWQISTYPASWGHASKSGNTIKIRLDANQSSSERTDWMEVTCRNCAVRINIQQEAKKYFTISSNQVNAPGEGGTYSFSVSTNESWSISTNTYDWGHLTRSGNSLTLRIDRNPLSSTRTDYFVIKSQSGQEQRVNITQQGYVAYLNLSTQSLTFSSSGGSQTITISSAPDWVVSVNPYNWGHLSRNGDYLTYRVDANYSSTNRTDYIKIKAGNIEKQISVTQYGSYSSSYNSNSYNSTPVSASIKRVWVDHSVYEGGQKGMRIHVNFDVNGMYNRTGQAAVYFYYSNGNPIKDTNNSYCTSNGDVATHVSFTPGYSNANYSDLKIFMPYNELHIYRTTSCYFTISIWNGSTVVTSGGRTSFNFNY